MLLSPLPTHQVTVELGGSLSLLLPKIRLGSLRTGTCDGQPQADGEPGAGLRAGHHTLSRGRINSNKKNKNKPGESISQRFSFKQESIKITLDLGDYLRSESPPSFLVCG